MKTPPDPRSLLKTDSWHIITRGYAVVGYKGPRQFALKNKSGSNTSPTVLGCAVVHFSYTY